MYYTIYRITNTINHKIYTGKHKTKDLNDGYMGSGKLIKAAIKKYGIENFTKEILFVFDNEKEMDSKEKELVIIGEMYYNLCEGGKGGWGYINKNNLCDHKKGYLKSREKIMTKYGVSNPSRIPSVREKISKDMKQKHLLGKIKPPNTKGYRLSDEHKRKIGKANSKNTGEKSSQYGTCWITNGVENRKIKKENLDDWLKLGYYKGRKT